MKIPPEMNKKHAALVLTVSWSLLRVRDGVAAGSLTKTALVPGRTLQTLTLLLDMAFLTPLSISFLQGRHMRHSRPVQFDHLILET